MVRKQGTHLIRSHRADLSTIAQSKFKEHPKIRIFEGNVDRKAVKDKKT
jgi:hypothetical protein